MYSYTHPRPALKPHPIIALEKAVLPVYTDTAQMPYQ